MAKKSPDIKYYEAVGRRKSAVARVRLHIVDKNKEHAVMGLKLNPGDIVINGISVDSYFPGIVAGEKYKLPFKLTETLDRFAVSALIKGSGKAGQLGAFIHGISRALQEADKGLRPILKKRGLLTRDARVKERRKVGTGGKARRKKQSPKR